MLFYFTFTSINFFSVLKFSKLFYISHEELVRNILKLYHCIDNAVLIKFSGDFTIKTLEQFHLFKKAIWNISHFCHIYTESCIALEKSRDVAPIRRHKIELELPFMGQQLPSIPLIWHKKQKGYGENSKSGWEMIFPVLCIQTSECPYTSARTAYGQIKTEYYKPKIIIMNK